MEGKDILDDFKAKGASASNDTFGQKEKNGSDAISAMREEISAIRGSNEKRDEVIVALHRQLEASAEREKELRSLVDRQSAKIQKLEGDFDTFTASVASGSLGASGMSAEKKEDMIFDKTLETSLASCKSWKKLGGLK